MPCVIIDGIEYVPKAEIPPITDSKIQGVLEVLTEMRYFNEGHKMCSLAWDAINELSPELAKLEPKAAFERVHRIEAETKEQ